jgi:Fe-S-cluster containining protein
VRTYFTFPDGGLKYDCPTCGQLCCRGKGFALGSGELIPLLGKAPSLAPHLYLRAGGSLGAIDLTDGCWFLAGDGNCSLESQHGRAAKPSTCRLFPFNRVFRVGDVRVVDMNSVLCPLQPADGDGARWEDLSREIDELVGLGASPLIDVPATSPLELPADWLAREERAPDEPEPPELAALAQSWARVYGIAPEDLAALESQASAPLGLLTPSLRFNTLFRKEGGLYPQLFAQLPRRLGALRFLAAMSVRAAGRAPSLRALTELWQLQSLTLDVLANWDEPVRLTKPQFGADVPETLQAPLGILLGGAFRGGKTLGELVELVAGSLDAPSRPLAVALAASQLTTLLPYGA